MDTIDYNLEAKGRRRLRDEAFHRNWSGPCSRFHHGAGKGGGMIQELADFLEEYGKHASLNFGQAMQGLRFLYSHPDIDREARRGSMRHLRLSLELRTKRVCNDLFFAALPPHWHHSEEEIKSLRAVSMKRWFQYGYCAWRFTEAGELKDRDGSEDPRWDPRCQ